MGQPWFKFWASAREDSKLRSLSDFEFRYWLMLLCLSCEQSGDGTLDISDLEDVCIDVGLVDDHGEPCVSALTEVIAKLARRKLVKRDGDALTFPSWARRQGKPSDRPEAIRERVAKHRKRQCNADVTPPVTPTEAEEEVEGEGERATRAGALPPCLSEQVDGVSWASVDGGSHPTAAKAFWAAVENARQGVVSTADHGLFASIVSETCPTSCDATPERIDACLGVLEKAAAKTKGKPTALFRRICEEDR